MMKPLVRQAITAAAAASLFLAAGTAAADVKAGVDAWQAGNFNAAVAEWRPLADAGDADAQFNLGQAYKLGRGGVPMDLRIAQGWYEKAARQGHGQAQSILGLILFQNGDRAAAMPWIKKGAENGDPRAQYVLGTAMFNGDLVAKDWPRAYALMVRAAAQGLPQAQSNLDQMNIHVPLAQRQQGVALAERMRTGAASASAAAAPLRAAPAPVLASRPAAPRPATAAARAGAWRIQLGAFGNADNARRQWDSLRGKVGAFAGLQPAMIRAGAITRLQAGPIASRSDADRICAAAKAAGSACFPVAP